MWKLASLFLSLSLWATDIEVALPTRSSAAPIYVSAVHTDSQESDWRYFDELRSALELDLNVGGFCAVMDRSPTLEESFHFPDARAHFEMPPWEKAKVPFVVAIESNRKSLQITAFQIEKKASKKYPEIPITGRVEEDRRAIHKLADALQKDLFGVEGIASLRVLYSQRARNFDAKDLDWTSEIWMCDADGSNARAVITKEGYCVCPMFLPKKGSDLDFFYVSYEQGQSKIFQASLHRPKGQPMVSLRGNQALPCISPQGTQMAFITDVAGRPDLFVQNFDGQGRSVGKARQLFSAPRSTQASPTYSPDGKKLAFVSDKDGPPRIYLLDIASSKNTQKARPEILTKKNRENTSPSWSPDGKKLAYSAKTDGVRQIWLYDFAAQEEVQLTSGPENKENPVWAPDNLHLIYNTEAEDVCELYLIHVGNPEPYKMSKGPGQKRFASWEPR